MNEPPTQPCILKMTLLISATSIKIFAIIIYNYLLLSHCITFFWVVLFVFSHPLFDRKSQQSSLKTTLTSLSAFVSRVCVALYYYQGVHLLQNIMFDSPDKCFSTLSTYYDAINYK